MLKYIVLGLFVLLFNVLDSVSTHIGLHKLPEKLRASESNPLMAGLMAHDNLLSEIVKHLFVFLLVVYFVYSKNAFILLALAIVLGIVVLSNTYTIVGRIITKRKIITPFGYLLRILKIPKSLDFFIFVIVFLGFAYWLAQYIVDRGNWL